MRTETLSIHSVCIFVVIAMTPDQAKAYLDKTMWYEMAELAKIQPMPDRVREMRRKAEEVLKQTHINAVGEG